MGKSAKAFKRPTRKEKELKRTLTRSADATDSRVTKPNARESVKNQAAGALKRDLQAGRLESTNTLPLTTALAAARKANGAGQRRFAKANNGPNVSKATASDYVDLYLGRKSTKRPETTLLPPKST
ncbi:hypothetical protein H4R35_001634 [Dimargaris xerosporica]|nr:hypothetical protein H4R35_001634 [Dimargaris xerosporica]